jgi:type IX secretion system PorP/SprF family membrane protein
MDMRIIHSRLLWVVLSALLTSFGLSAQQPPQFSLYFLDPMQWNPAYAGMGEGLQITALLRQQWAGLEGNPQSQLLSAHVPVSFSWGGLGISLLRDQLGAGSRTGGQLNYTYQLSVGEGLLAVGGGLAFNQWQLDGRLLRTPQGDYDQPGQIEHNDDLLTSGVESGQLLSLALGVYYSDGRLFGGLSASHVNQPVATSGNFTYRQLRAFFANAGYNLFPDRDWSLIPMFWVRSDEIQTQVDISLQFAYNNNIFAGLSFRGYDQSSTDAAVLSAGIRLKERMRVFYAFDLPLSTLRDVHNGSHEIGLTYNINAGIGQGKLPAVIYHPRANR